MLELPEDMQSRPGYRIAYDEAARLAEMDSFTHDYRQNLTAVFQAALRPTRGSGFTSRIDIPTFVT
jgi:hypothetical protein